MRIEPLMPASAYTTYAILAPLATHFRAATCEEVDCPNWRYGWKTILPSDSDLIAVLKGSGRAYTETKAPGGLVEFTFKPGQSCFKASQHRVRIERPELFVRRPGDFRGNPTRERPFVHAKPEHWVEDFATHQDDIRSEIEKG